MPNSYRPCLDEFDCNPVSEKCYSGRCYCRRGFYIQEEYCWKCPSYGQYCQERQCCFESNTFCAEDGFCRCLNGVENFTCITQNPIYITASQIALSAALIMGMAALTMVVYRLCTKPRYLSARQRALASRTGADAESLSYANYLRASLTSMQIRVLTRMRDRPPSYDARQTPTTLQADVPPPYEGGSTEAISTPPPYSEIIVNPAGYINATMVDIDPDGDGTSTQTRETCDTNKVGQEPIEDKAETVNESRILS